MGFRPVYWSPARTTNISAMAQIQSQTQCKKFTSHAAQKDHLAPVNPHSLSDIL